ncbi:hypothetical protein D1614_18790 [Maribellus luteus]|uniref:Calcineurin-like phosphoesterase domain-containing protein n=1 Tax=Maribellus luteus TaxID=2305463 RepID=A0A399SRN2_9BACT|nr:metallophosphoesterase [Maribellus luteus]RIJ46460.1 hypothetical protein D1614_18790 [Maribellus luteus]
MRIKLILVATFALLFTSNSISFAQTYAKEAQNNEKLFSFGLIADPQYVDKETRGNRYYRNSLNKLETCVQELNQMDLAMTVCLGDLIDCNYSSYDSILPILHSLQSSTHKVLGNHDFDVEDAYIKNVRARLKNKKGYYSFNINGFTFIVLDGTDLSLFGTTPDSKAYRLANKKMIELKTDKHNNAHDWNGGLGKKQIKWFDKQLVKAEKRNKNLIIFCHWPLLPENDHQLWDNRLILGKIGACPNVVAWISGHFHKGYYKEENNIHHLTIKGMVESEHESTYGVIDVYQDRLILRGYGEQKSITLKY